MHLIPRAFRRLRRSQTRASRGTARRLQLEPLEVRDMMTALPLTIVNDAKLNGTDFAYSDDQVWVAIYATKQEDGTFYYFDKSGNATSVNGLAQVPTYQLSTFTPVSGQPHTYTINMPDTMPMSQFGPIGTRMYFGLGTTSQLDLAVNKITSDFYTVAPMAANDSYFDYVEFTINGKDSTTGLPLGNLNIDTTNVDQFGVPLYVNVNSSEVSSDENPIGTSTTRNSVVAQYTDFTLGPGDPYSKAVWPTDGEFGTYRIQNPSDVLTGGTVENTGLEVIGFTNAAVSSTTSSVLVQPTMAFPLNPTSADPFTIQIDNEMMTVTNASVGAGGVITWTVSRGAGATTHTANAKIHIVGPAINSTQTNITMANVSGYPKDPSSTPFYIRVGTEIMQVVGVSPMNAGGSITWTVERGQFGTTPTSHARHRKCVLGLHTRPGAEQLVYARDRPILSEVRHRHTVLEVQCGSERLPGASRAIRPHGRQQPVRPAVSLAGQPDQHSGIRRLLSVL